MTTGLVQILKMKRGANNYKWTDFLLIYCEEITWLTQITIVGNSAIILGKSCRESCTKKLARSESETMGLV